MTKLTGKALSARAAELQIEGRSKMTADELREAIANVERLSAVPDTATDRNGEFLIPAGGGVEPTTVVPNRADKRAMILNHGTNRNLIGGIILISVSLNFLISTNVHTQPRFILHFSRFLSLIKGLDCVCPA